MLDTVNRPQASGYALVERARQGGRRAQLELVGAIAAPVRCTLYRLLGSQAPIELLLEATLLRAISGPVEYDQRQPLVLWAQGIAVRIALSFLSGVRKPRQGPPPPETEHTVRGLLDRVHSRLRDLSPEDQVAFALLHVEGRPLEEAALLMRVQPLAVRRCAERAQQRLLFLARGDQMIATYLRLSGLLCEAARRLGQVTAGSAPHDPVCARIASRLSVLSV
jgi:DNA-directed RNA polymerase specialized sigma24 family protein